jgi:hypothetical protein
VSYRYQVGDVISLPPEPPVGTTIKTAKSAGGFSLKRKVDGWYIIGGDRAITWKAIAELWFPVAIVRLPPAGT